MIDALLYSVRDTIRGAKIGYSVAECEITDDGKPPPRAGNVFVAVHGGKSHPGDANDNNLYELFDFSVTLTMRITIAQDRVGDQLMARNTVLVPLGQKQGFDHKVEQLRSLLHMNWGMIVLKGQNPKSANDNIIEWATGAAVYGFCEPARFQGADTPTGVGGDWLGAEPSEDGGPFALKSELRFVNAKRFQPVISSVGPFV